MIISICWECHSRSPVLVRTLESITSVGVLKRPPAGIPRQFPTTQTVLFGVSSNGSQEIEEIGDDFRARVRLDADRNKSVEGVAREVRVWGVWLVWPKREGATIPCSPTLNSSYASQVTTPPGSLLQHHLTTLQSTCSSISPLLYRMHCQSRYTIGSVSRSSCVSASPVIGVPFCAALKKFRMKLRAALGSELGRNGSRRKGMSSPVPVSICLSRYARAATTNYTYPSV